jgi:hypothetical protein
LARTASNRLAQNDGLANEVVATAVEWDAGVQKLSLTIGPGLFEDFSFVSMGNAQRMETPVSSSMPSQRIGSPV